MAVRSVSSKVFFVSSAFEIRRVRVIKKSQKTGETYFLHTETQQLNKTKIGISVSNRKHVKLIADAIRPRGFNLV